MPLKPISQIDFSGGENLVVNPYLISNKQVARANNMWLDEHGSLRTRNGITTLTTSPDLLNKIVYRGLFVKNDSSELPFAIQFNNAGTSTLWRTDTTPWTSVGTFTQREITPDSVTIDDKQFIVNGYETPKLWDGATFTSITSQPGQTTPPGAKHVTFHLGSIWLWNTNPSTTLRDGPSSLRMGAANKVDDWDDTDQTFVSKDDGQVGMGMSPFTIAETGISPTDTLVLFKNYSGYQVTGVFNGSNFSLQRIKSDMGCVAPRTIQFVAGFGIIRLSHKGFALYNGVEDRLISEEVRPAIFGGPSGEEIFESLDFPNIPKAWAAQCPNPPLYIAACPLQTSPGLTRIFVYDLIRRGWTLMTLPAPISCVSLYLSRLSFPILQAGGTADGNIYELFRKRNFEDDGVEIGWDFTTKAYFQQNQMEPSFWRRAQFSMLGQPNHFVTVTPVVDGAARSPQTFRFPDSTQDLIETAFSPDIRETAHTVQLKVAGVGRVVVRGAELQASQKPVTKYVSRRGR